MKLQHSMWALGFVGALACGHEATTEPKRPPPPSKLPACAEPAHDASAAARISGAREAMAAGRKATALPLDAAAVRAACNPYDTIARPICFEGVASAYSGAILQRADKGED